MSPSTAMMYISLIKMVVAMIQEKKTKEEQEQVKELTVKMLRENGVEEVAISKALVAIHVTEALTSDDETEKISALSQLPQTAGSLGMGKGTIEWLEVVKETNLIDDLGNLFKSLFNKEK